MDRRNLFLFITSFLLLSLTYSHSKAVSFQQRDTVESSEKIDLYIDCDYCYKNYIRSNITFVNYVRNRMDAELQLVITSASTGGDGRQFKLYFYGRKRFENENDTLTYFSPETDTRSARRQGLIDHIKIGLTTYLASTTLVDLIDIKVQQPESSKKKDKSKKWNNWMFEISSSLSANGRETRKSLRYYGSGRAERITEDWKMRFNVSSHFDWTHFNFDNREDRTTRQISHNYNSLVAKSLTPHWSLGLYSNVSSSTFNNMDISAGISPAVEYNIFPYSEHNTREISFRYRITPRYHNYINETIYFKFEEYLFEQALSSRIEYTQPWGQIDFTIRGSSHLLDFPKNRLTFNGSLELQVFKGFSIDFYGRYAIINNQIEIPRGGATYEEVLLNLRQQATSYSFYGRAGISYSFGALYNNIVNPRF